MQYESTPLKRILGTPTAWLLGMGVAIGSGIFRTPGDVAAGLPAPWLIVVGWSVGGVIALLQGLVTAELATRFPQAGGEYVFLREAYGDFLAFFFGWAYTIFVIGGGAATIALAFGDFGCELMKTSGAWSGPPAAAAIAIIVGVNAFGLRVGAGAQNVLTATKVGALLAIAAASFLFGSGVTPAPAAPMHPPFQAGGSAALAAMLAILWSYSGTTDSVKLAEEIKDVRRALPLALVGSALTLALVYVIFNVALMRLVPPQEMAGLTFVPGEAMVRVFGDGGRKMILVAAMLVCLGALSSSILATIRVTFALARDGLTFRFMSRMSKSQAPVPALVVVGGFAVVLVLNRNFGEVLGIYFLASAVLFGLAYASLIVFRVRDRRSGLPTAGIFRCPLGIPIVFVLIAIQLALAINIAVYNPADAVYTLLMLVVLGLLYFAWRVRSWAR